MKIWDLLNSNLFQWVITIIVGYSAFLLYKKQQIDNKRNISKMIFTEICEIEKGIERLRGLESDMNIVNWYNTTSIITEDTWGKNKFLFINDLNSSEYSSINTFYEVAKRIEEERTIIRNNFIIGTNEKVILLQQKIYERVCAENNESNNQVHSTLGLLTGQLTSNEFGTETSKIFNLITTRTPVFMSPDAMYLITSLSKEIEKISISTAGKKLDEIGKSKYFIKVR